MGRLSDDGRISDEEFLAFKKRKKLVALLKAMLALTTLICIGLWVYESKTHTVQRVSQYFFSTMDSSTTGTITKSQKSSIFGRNWSTYVHDIRYRYEVSGREFFGDLVNYKTSSKDVNLILRSYPVGKVVIVYFDSNNPNSSVLVQDRLDLEYLLVFLLIVIFSPFAIWGLYALFYEWYPD